MSIRQNIISILHTRKPVIIDGGDFFTYTPTHYVAPFASVSGASSDEDPQNATAYSNATNPATPCTLQCAHKNAVAPHRIRCAPGVYDGVAINGNRFIPVWFPTFEGTSHENSIIFFAQYPAPYFRNNPELWTELRRQIDEWWFPGQPEIGATINPVVGASAGDGQGRDYVYWDGFYVNERVSRAGPSAGCMLIQGGSTGVRFRRFLIDRRNMSNYGTWTEFGASYNGFNGNSFFSQDCEDCRAQDCYVWGNDFEALVGNDGCHECYSSRNFIVEHCTFYKAGGGPHFKAGGNLNAVSRYNWIESEIGDGQSGLTSQICTNTIHHHNLVKFKTQGMNWFNPHPMTVTGATSANPIQITVLNNHFLSTGMSVSFFGMPGDFGTNLDDNNYVITVVNATTFTINVNGSGFASYTSGGTSRLVSSIQAYNNTIICTGGSFNTAWYHRASRVSDGTDAYYNNIIYVNGSGSCQFVEYEPNSVFGVDVDEFDRLNHNVYYRADGGTPRWVIGGASRTSFSGGGSYQEYMATHGMDAHGDVYESDSIYADPEFTNYAANDFTLQAGSPALTAGVGGTICGAFDGTGEPGIRTNPAYSLGDIA